MKLAHGIWLIASFVISLGTNFLLVPRVEEGSYAAGSTLASGHAVVAGSSEGFKLLDLRVVATEATSLIGHSVPVQLVVMRSAIEEGQSDADLELFIDLTPADGSAFDASARNIDALRRRPFAVLTKAPGSSAISHVRLPGAESAAAITRGTFTITDAIEVSPQTYRVRGELDVELRSGEHTQAMLARVVAKLGW